MTKRNLIILVALLLIAICLPSFGQTILTNTTLSAAATTSYGQTVVVTSATGISAPSTSDYTKATSLYVDRELMDVVAVNSTTIRVARGVNGTKAAAHASGAFVFVVPSYLSTQFGTVPQGSCTRTNEVALPRIEARSGVISDCLGGIWANSGPDYNPYTQPAGIRLPDPGGVAYTALETNGTAAGAATEEYCTELNIPASMVITGLGVLNGTTATTDKHLVVLRDSAGKVLATSAVAGATASGASTYQKYAFTAPYFAVGPARYFGCMQANGTTATVRHAITTTNDNVLAGKLTSQTFGTVVAATMPTTFTTALGPYFLVY